VVDFKVFSRFQGQFQKIGTIHKLEHLTQSKFFQRYSVESRSIHKLSFVSSGGCFHDL